MSEMRDLIQHINEADPFKGVSKEDLDMRQSAQKKTIEDKIAKFKKERGKIADICPHCGSDLREVGVEEDETQYGISDRVWNGTSWDWGKFHSGDNDIGDSRCRHCENSLDYGTDWGE